MSGEDKIKITDKDGNLINPATEDGKLAEIKSKTDNLDVLLSTRASESTLSGIRSQTDKLTFDTDNRLAVQNPPNLDVLLSTRASESTLAAIKARTDKIPDFPAREDGNLASIKANTDKLDVLLSTRASESTLTGIKARTDKIPDDPARENGNLASIKSKTDNLDIALSTRASEQTLLQVKQNTDRIPTNPATEDGNLNDLLQILKQLAQTAIFKAGIVNPDYLKIYVMNPYYTSVSSGGNIATAGAPTLGTPYFFYVWQVPIDQRWEVMQRANIEYNECQRSKFTFV